MSTNDHLTRVTTAVRRAPGFEDVRDDECQLLRLGGLTNLVHRVDVRNQRIIVRLAGEGTEAYIDRSIEARNAEAAYAAGVSAEVLFTDTDTGLMISKAIDNITTMTPELFASRNGAPARAGKALAQLHGSGQVFQFQFNLFSMIEEYLKILSTKEVELPDGYHDVVEASTPVKEALALQPAQLAPCHCDPLCENFLDDDDRMWIVDWEYSGMNDPLWDVGDLSVEASLDEAQELALLHAYFGQSPTPAQHGRVIVYKAMCDLLWTLWGLIQLADDNPADDFWAYATGRFDRCKELMRHPDFACHLAAVQKG